jgi:hypothetical protein
MLLEKGLCLVARDELTDRSIRFPDRPDDEERSELSTKGIDGDFGRYRGDCSGLCSEDMVDLFTGGLRS